VLSSTVNFLRSYWLVARKTSRCIRANWGHYKQLYLPTKNTFCRTRSLSNFYYWSCDVYPVQNLLLCTKFHQNWMIFYWDMAIYRFSKWRPSAILELFYCHMRPPTKSLYLAAAGCNISCQSDTQIWRYSYLIFLHIWLEMPIQAPKWRFWGILDH